MKPSHLFADVLAVISGGAALATWQVQLDWALRITAAMVAIAAGSVALYQRLKKPASATREE